MSLPKKQEEGSLPVGDYSLPVGDTDTTEQVEAAGHHDSKSGVIRRGDPQPGERLREQAKRPFRFLRVGAHLGEELHFFRQGFRSSNLGSNPNEGVHIGHVP